MKKPKVCSCGSEEVRLYIREDCKKGLYCCEKCGKSGPIKRTERAARYAWNKRS